MRRFFVLPAVCLLALAGCGGSPQNPGGSSGGEVFVTIGTGSVTGVYYPTGVEIAKLIDLELADQGIKASVESTSGSVYNVNAVGSGELMLGIVQSDRQYQAVNGLKEWDGKPQTKLRAICSLHPETVALIASIDSGISAISALKGHRVNLGNAGSGQRGNAEDVVAAFGLGLDELTVSSAPAVEAPLLLQGGEIDAFFFTAGHPNDTLREACEGERAVRFVPITGEAVTQLLAEKPYYTAATILKKHYPKAGGDNDIATIGVRATLVVSADTPEKVVYGITKAIVGNVDKLKTRHEALEQLDAKSMLQGLSAPLHPGAERYFTEAGLK